MENEIKRVLISVTDKRGVVEFAKELAQFNCEILSTGGTAVQLRENGIDVVDVSKYTGFPEMMDGRLKTLHPKIHGGLLALRDNDEHLKALKKHRMSLIDMVVINLYRFEDTVAREDCTLEEAFENIDIGGPTMIRAAAKNWRFVSVVTDPGDYERVIAEIKERAGKISRDTNFALAVKAFQQTARYDAAISNYLSSADMEGGRREFPDMLTLQFEKARDLRYGENPHQKAVFYRERDLTSSSIPNARVLQGKELSYNNIMDSDAAWQMVNEFTLPTAVIVKHANPCGVASSSESIKDAYRMALQTDDVSAFGGIVSFNRPVDKATAEELSKIFLEVVVAPDFDEDALEVLSGKKNLRLLAITPPSDTRMEEFDFRRVAGGLLVQERDTGIDNVRTAQVMTQRPPTEDEYQALDFAWKVVKNVKSNAIVLAAKDHLVGVGAGQMSRVDAVKLAIMKANQPTKGTVLASDAFFPFRDSVDIAAAAGVTAIIQPGGSIRDEDAVKAADEHGIAMIFTAKRHFKH